MRKVIGLAVAAAVMVGASCPRNSNASSTGEGITGNQFIKLCNESPRYDEGECFAYILGTYHGFTIAESLHDVEPLTCVPSTVTVDQLSEVVIKYLRNNPQNRHLPARGLVMIAIRNAFPCN